MNKRFFLLFVCFSCAFLYASTSFVPKFFFGQGFSEISVDDFFEKTSDNSNIEPTSEEKSEIENDKNKEQNDGAYSSATSHYVVVGVGSAWYYETLNEAGRPTLKVWYEGSEKVKTEEYTYSQGKLTEMLETAGEKKVIYYYGESELETKRVETSDKGEIITETFYNGENLISRLKTFFQGFESEKVFFYNANNKIKSEEYYENGFLVSKTEYAENKRLVSIYENGTLLKVFEEPL